MPPPPYRSRARVPPREGSAPARQVSTRLIEEQHLLHLAFSRHNQSPRRASPHRTSCLTRWTPTAPICPASNGRWRARFPSSRPGRATSQGKSAGEEEYGPFHSRPPRVWAPMASAGNRKPEGLQTMKSFRQRRNSCRIRGRSPVAGLVHDPIRNAPERPQGSLKRPASPTP